ncbi:MAG: nuclear transport factor 2 family protein [Limnothrix sp.]
MIEQQAAKVAVENYFAYLCAKDAEQWVQLFSEDAISYDPVGGPVNLIHRDYLKFFELLKFYRELKSAPVSMFFAGGEMAVQWEMQVTAINGKEGSAAGISVFSFDASGKISLLKAYWDDRQLMAQLR